MRVRFWGTRGSVATPGKHTAIYGGNTSCVEVRPSDDSVLIFDCGTGIRDLGRELLRSKAAIKRVYLLVGHVHWDHIQGFPFFSLAFLPDLELNIYAPVGFQRSLQEAISGQMQYSYFPVKLQDLASRIYFTELGEGFFRIGSVLVETRFLNHTAPTLAYRVTDAATSIAYVTDHEPFWSVPGPVFLHPGDRQHVEFLRNADLIIHDAQYTAEEYQAKRGWGHSTIEYATDVAVAARAGKLALFHHDPTHNDEIVKKMEEVAQKRAASYGCDLEVFAAAEGSDIEVTGRGRSESSEGISALASQHDQVGQILVLSEDVGDVAAVRGSLVEEGCITSATSDIAGAFAIVEQSCPDVVIMSATISRNLPQDIEALRTAAGNKDLPILLLTGAAEDNEGLAITHGLATDYIAKPFSPPMLRCRVHAWRTRTSVNPDARGVHPEKRSRGPVNTSSFLASSSIFGLLKPAELFQLTGNGFEETYPIAHEIVQQGEHSDSVYAVLSGRVRVVETVPETSVSLILGELGAGEIFGELGVLRNEPRSATVVSVKETTCLKIPQADFVGALENSAQFRQALLQILAQRLNRTGELLGRHVPDSVTRLPSRRAFRELYSRFASRALRHKGSLLLLAIDVVGLKSINDRYGYTTGDEVLRAVADTLIELCGNDGVVARYGGDEFAVLFLDMGKDQASELVERIRAVLHQTSIRRSLPVSIDCSIGLVATEKPPLKLDDLLRQADAGMHNVGLAGDSA